MYINQAGLDLIKHFEGFCADAYYCPARVLTIGYGTTGSRVKSHRRSQPDIVRDLLR